MLPKPVDWTSTQRRDLSRYGAPEEVVRQALSELSEVTSEFGKVVRALLHTLPQMKEAVENFTGCLNRVSRAGDLKPAELALLAKAFSAVLRELRGLFRDAASFTIDFARIASFALPRVGYPPFVRAPSETGGGVAEEGGVVLQGEYDQILEEAERLRDEERKERESD